MSADVRDAGPIEAALKRLYRAYPLVDGYGTLASTPLALSLVPRSHGPVWASVAGQRCAVRLDDFVGRALFFGGDLDRKVSRTLAALVRPGDTVVDVGANLGVVTLLAARRVGASGRVIAFEPSPDTLPLLRRTLAARPVAPVTLHACALGRTTGTAEFVALPGNAGKSAMRSVVGDGPVAGIVHTVPVRRLGEVLLAERVGRVALLKIDVEGFELPVLEGLFDVPGAPRPDAIIIESNRPADDPALHRLRAEGYTLTGLTSWAHLRVRQVQDGTPQFDRCHDFVARRAG